MEPNGTLAAKGTKGTMGAMRTRRTNGTEGWEPGKPRALGAPGAPSKPLEPRNPGNHENQRNQGTREPGEPMNQALKGPTELEGPVELTEPRNSGNLNETIKRIETYLNIIASIDFQSSSIAHFAGIIIDVTCLRHNNTHWHSDMLSATCKMHF